MTRGKTVALITRHCQDGSLKKLVVYELVQNRRTELKTVTLINQVLFTTAWGTHVYVPGLSEICVRALIWLHQFLNVNAELQTIKARRHMIKCCIEQTANFKINKI